MIVIIVTKGMVAQAPFGFYVRGGQSPNLAVIELFTASPIGEHLTCPMVFSPRSVQFFSLFRHRQTDPLGAALIAPGCCPTTGSPETVVVPG